MRKKNMVCDNLPSYTEKPFILVLPHWSSGGGAGFYICDLIELLRQEFKVKVAGVHGADYDPHPVLSWFLERLASLNFPMYEGVRLPVTLLYLARSVMSGLRLLATPASKNYEDKPAVFVFTSSIQVLSIPLTKIYFPDSKIVIVIQEHVDLSRAIGRFAIYLLRKSDVVLSITNEWANHARGFGLDPIVLRNQYETSFAEPEQNTKPIVTSDLLYVGGGSRVKGFDGFIAALPFFLETPGRKVVCLGSYNQQALDKLERIKNAAHSKSSLQIDGQVSDIRPYIRGTKLLLLPIGSPHFCRPAVEAGLFSKPFVIPNYPSLNEFANDGGNCKKYHVGDTQGLVHLVNDLLDDELLLNSLGQGNLQLATRFQVSNQEVLFNLKKVLSL